MRVKFLVLALICFFVFAYCNSPADPQIEEALNPGNPGNEIEETTETRIKFSLDVQHCGYYPSELEEIAWYQIFEIYINDGVGTYGDGLLLHTHEFGRGGGFYYELPDRNYSFIPALDFPGTRESLLSAYERNTESDFEVWFYLKESNIPPELMHKLKPRILIDLAPRGSGFECSPFNLDSGCLNDIYHPDSWRVGERTLPDPCFAYSRLWFRVMIVDDGDVGEPLSIN